METIGEQLEKNSIAAPALKLYLLMLNLKSFIKEDEINGLNANQETATWKRAAVEISNNLQ